MKKMGNFKFQVIQGKPAMAVLIVLILIGLPLVLLGLALALCWGLARAALGLLTGGVPAKPVRGPSGEPEVLGRPDSQDSWGDREIIDVKAEVLDVSAETRRRSM